jgi:hypothetical protein
MPKPGQHCGSTNWLQGVAPMSLNDITETGISIAPPMGLMVLVLNNDVYASEQ